MAEDTEDIFELSEKKIRCGQVMRTLFDELECSPDIFSALVLFHLMMNFACHKHPPQEFDTFCEGIKKRYKYIFAEVNRIMKERKLEDER